MVRGVEVERKPRKRTYIGVKLIRAEPMTRGFYNNIRGWSIPADENPDDAGYLVTYPDGYVSWSPMETFESAYFPISAADAITESDVEAFVDMDNILLSKLGKKTAVAQVRCVTGFEITKSSACVRPENYDGEKGACVAMADIKKALWSHLGFVLQWATNGINNKG